eukprot:gene13832-13953_t
MSGCWEGSVIHKVGDDCYPKTSAAVSLLPQEAAFRQREATRLSQQRARLEQQAAILRRRLTAARSLPQVLEQRQVDHLKAQLAAARQALTTRDRGQQQAMLKAMADAEQKVLGDLWELLTAAENEVYRQQLLGFNAVRLPFSFRDFSLPGRTDYIYCTPASEDDIRKSVTPPGVNTYAKPFPRPRVALTVGNGMCNIGMPNNVFDRFLWVINLYARAGFKIVIDNHVWLEDPTAYENTKAWIDGWVRLARGVSKDPEARGVVMYDLVNEPDNKKIFWNKEMAQQHSRPTLTNLYKAAMEAIYKVQPDAIFVLEIGYAIPSGDGFVTDANVIKQFNGKSTKTSRYTIKGIEDPNPFFTWLMKQPFAQNVVWGPHFYAQSVIPFDLPKQYMQVTGS